MLAFEVPQFEPKYDKVSEEFTFKSRSLLSVFENISWILNAVLAKSYTRLQWQIKVLISREQNRHIVAKFP